jgi:cobalt-zinc-cadmium efflux system membrane fusion protein
MQMGKLVRFLLLITVLAVGVVGASTVPQVSQFVRSIGELIPAAGMASRSQEAPARQQVATKTNDEGGARLGLTPDQIVAAKIDVAAVGGGVLVRRISVPGSIVPNGDRIARVSVKLSGTVAQLRKKLGDTIAKNEVVAVLESREVADAKSDYLAARLTDELQQELFERDKALWDKHVSNEQQFLRSRNAAAQTRMRLDIARQKLLALGLDEAEIATLPNEPEALLRIQEVRSPIAGRVVERKVDLGTAVGRDNLETELFVVVDLQSVWVELSVSPADLPAIREGQTVTIAARGIPGSEEGKIVFISPLLDKDTRSARVIAEIANRDEKWRPGSFVTATIATDTQQVPLAVPADALQTVENEQVVFVRIPEGFERRPVVVGRRDARMAEIVRGLRPGEQVAVTNTFALKAESLKALAED